MAGRTLTPPTRRSADLRSEEAITKMPRQAEWIAPAFGPVLSGEGSASVVPPIDVFEGHEAIVVRAAVPGMAPEDMVVDINGELLSIRGAARGPALSGDWHAHVAEIAGGAIRRMVILPAPVTIDGAEAVLERGIMTLTLPRARLTAGETTRIRLIGVRPAE